MIHVVYHKPVLVEEVLTYLNPEPGKRYLDVTFGGGGHTRAILEREPSCSVIGLDWDAVALEKNGYPLQEEFIGRLQLLWGNFSQVDRLLKKEGIESVDGIIADFGTSQYQLLERPGFSFYNDTPLDMRMSPAHQKVTAQEIVNKASESKLYEIFRDLGQDTRARRIAHIIVQERSKQAIVTSGQLARLIERAVPRGGKKTHPATQTFQALRMYVNKELENIHSFLIASLRILKPEGRLVCISFHSGEDRLVKNFFKEHATIHPLLEVITPHVIEATPEEVKNNPSSRSAKLRAARLKKSEIV
jgi:16S rRNA (cytosine1402-N4)-methyltransferase